MAIATICCLAAVLEGREEYEIVDQNIEDDPVERILKLIDTHEVELLGVSAMPGLQRAAGKHRRGFRKPMQAAWLPLLACQSSSGWTRGADLSTLRPRFLRQ